MPTARPAPVRTGGASLVWPLLLSLVLTACATDGTSPGTRPISPSEARATLDRALPEKLAERKGWATDIYAAFAAQGLNPSADNLCAAIAVIEQESSFRADPTVPGLPAIAWREIDQRADSIRVPKMLVRAALKLPSPDGRSYSERIDAVKTERELSDIFDDFIGMVPVGRSYFAERNPIRTGGPMQVSIAFAQEYASTRPYPYPLTGSLRKEVFTRRGGLYFGIAHLLDYPANYDRMIYRFADFNAGHHASRNAALQNAISLTSGIPLRLDGDLIRFDGDGRTAGATELAARVLGPRIRLDDAAIRSDLELGKGPELSNSRLFRRVFELADQLEGRPAPRAVMPGIDLKSPKITRQLTTEWFAERVQTRHERCLKRAAPTTGT